MATSGAAMRGGPVDAVPQWFGASARFPEATPSPRGRSRSDRRLYSGGMPSISNERVSSGPIGTPSRSPFGSVRTNHLL